MFEKPAIPLTRNMYKQKVSEQVHAQTWSRCDLPTSLIKIEEVNQNGNKG